MDISSSLWYQRQDESETTLEIAKPPHPRRCPMSAFSLAGALAALFKMELEQLLTLETLTNQELYLYPELSL